MKFTTPIVPQELDHLLDERVLGVHEKHANMSYEYLLQMTRLTGLDSSNPDSRRFGGIMFGHLGADFEAGVSIYAGSYQQAWKPSKAASALFFHDVVNPDGFTIVLPNNSGDQKYYEFSDEDLEKMNSGDMRPFFEHQIKTVEQLLGSRAIGDVSIAGFSQGALVGLGMAAVGSDKFSFKKANLFEAPSEERTPKKLKSDFTRSAHPLDQRRAIKDAAIPALSKSLRIDRLTGDYIRFGLDSSREDSKSLMNAMATPGIDRLATEALARNDELDLLIGYIEGSRMRGDAIFSETIESRVTVIGAGRGSHRHATSDNIVANALMMSL